MALEQNYTLTYRRETIVDQIVKILEQQILSGKLSPGSKLSEKMVATEFKVSRLPAREVLLRLEDMNLVKKTNTGREIMQFSLEEFRELYELKNGIEAYGTTLGSSRVTDAELENINKVVEKMKEALNEKDYYNLMLINHHFHDLLVASSKNKKLIDTFISIAKQVRWVWVKTFDLPFRRSQGINEHLAIYRAFKNRDTRTVRELLDKHTENNLKRIVTLLE